MKILISGELLTGGRHRPGGVGTDWTLLSCGSVWPAVMRTGTIAVAAVGAVAGEAADTGVGCAAAVVGSVSET